MNKKILRKSFLYSIVFFITSCVTINIYFPAAAVEKAADKIVEEVWGAPARQPEQQEQKKPNEPQSMIPDLLKVALILIGPNDAYAQGADINITTPAIRKLKGSIQERADSIKPFMDSENVGISDDGLLLIRNTEGLNLKDKANLKRIIEAENKDREALYEEIAKANNFPPDRISDIKKIFADSWIKNARKGWWFQDKDGKWIKK
jgi:uncharacterized protein YdbL (DUF1318 family)